MNTSLFFSGSTSNSYFEGADNNSNSLELTHQVTLGNLSALPVELIFLFLSNLQVQDLLRTSLVNKTFYQLSQTPLLWKQLTLRLFPDFTPSNPVINWKDIYKQESKDEKNFLLLRQRTCSGISDIVPSRHNLFTRARALTGTPVTHYFSFDGKGHLQAVFYNKVDKVYNVYGKIQKISSSEWNVKASIHRQFIFLSFFDGRHPFSPTIELKPISTLNSQQKLAVNNLQEKINTWFKQTEEAADLDEQVKETLKNHYNPVSTISCSGPEGQRIITAKHKAYFIFLRALIDNPPFEEFSNCPPANFFMLKSNKNDESEGKI